MLRVCRKKIGFDKLSDIALKKAHTEAERVVHADNELRKEEDGQVFMRIMATEVFLHRKYVEQIYAL